MDPDWLKCKPGDDLPTNNGYDNDFLTAFPFDFDDAVFSTAQESAPTTSMDQLLYNLQPNSSAFSAPGANSAQTTPENESLNIGFPFMEDSPFMTSLESSPAEDWLFQSPSDESELNSASTTTDTTKRARNNADSMSACWTSPICPNKKGDGTRPDSCKGECADYLFAHPSQLPEDKKRLSELMKRSEPRIAVESPNRNRKRSEMESTPEQLGRRLATTTNSDDKPTITATISSSRTSHIDRRAPIPPPTTAQPTPTTQQQTQSARYQQPKPKGRVPHNQVEKKYRENVNTQLEALRRIVPASKQQLVGFDGLDIEDLTNNARQPSKAVVLSSATAYIRQLEKEKAQLLKELEELKAQNKTLQSLVKCEDCSLVKYMRRWKLQVPV